MNQANNMTASFAPVLMTMQEASDALQISRWQLYQLINQRRLNTVKIGRRRFILPDDLHAFIAELRQEGGD
ncbi:MAG TPA: helix-turn-helix domain-containing protein [Pseudonocardiaceae bacterium]|jgi:excisionase family DNA binding protein|nr:helix-turn-helix domain-containing protein [Pseudonocardiaceae bacterium]